jgi:hypothetical protein
MMHEPNRDLHKFIEGVAWEPENDKPGLMAAFDELVSTKVDSVHIERMDDGCYWMSLNKGDKRQVIVISAVNSRAKIVARTERTDK